MTLAQMITLVTMRIYLLTTVIFITGKQVAALDCYTCVQAADNSECSRPEDLKDCQTMASPGMEFDTCQTRIEYSEGVGTRITKRCVQGPCSLGGAQDGALGLGCDRSGSHWSCETCCSSGGCNVSDGCDITYNVGFMISLLLAALVL